MNVCLLLFFSCEHHLRVLPRIFSHNALIKFYMIHKFSDTRALSFGQEKLKEKQEQTEADDLN